MQSWLDSFFANKMIDRFGDGDEQFLSKLMKSAREGHLCVRESPNRPLPQEMVSSGAEPFPLSPIVHSNGRYYLQRNWVYESLICREVQRLSQRLPEQAPPLDRLVADGRLQPGQAQAIQYAFEHQLTVLSGGPGTGKTYTAGHLIRLLVETSNVKRLYKVRLTAPTGKAAQQLHASFRNQGIEADVRTETLHRLLGIYPGKSRLFSDRKIDADLVVVDEASMIDVDLWAHLLEAIGSKTRLVLLGDPNQLPPIEAGSIFADLTEHCGIQLERCMRTEDKELQQLAQGIQRGDFEAVSQLLSSGIGGPFLWDPESIYQEIAPPIFQSLPDPAKCLEYYNRFRVLGALRQGPFGIDTMNEELLRLYTRQMRRGDYWAVPILICSNEPRLGLYNGSAGVLIGPYKGFFQPRDGTAYFSDSGGGVRSFQPNVLPSYEWAFCLSIHKSQGSEFERVVALFPPGSETFGREALYTAATRAKKSLKILIESALLRELVVQKSRKMSGVLERLIS
ncbi:MAG: AAA family ATPase [Verrucomicrobia bacterium]|nr:AAA family ATPase [Verrucomicrobiota bacterium]